jgi:hypothetical protein
VLDETASDARVRERLRHDDAGYLRVRVETGDLVARGDRVGQDLGRRTDGPRGAFEACRVQLAASLRPSVTMARRTAFVDSSPSSSAVTPMRPSR